MLRSVFHIPPDKETNQLTDKHRDTWNHIVLKEVITAIATEVNQDD